MKILKSFKIKYNNDEFYTMYSHIDDNRYYMTYKTNMQILYTEISHIEYITALIKYLPTYINNT